MTKFTFRLQRVLEWRQAQVRVEEVHLARKRAVVQKVDAEIAAVAKQASGAQRELIALSRVTGAELAALGAFREQCIVRTMQLTLQRAEAQKAVEQQILKTAQCRRQARLLERLRERRVEEWRL